VCVEQVPGGDERVLTRSVGSHDVVRHDPAHDVRPRAMVGGGAPDPRGQLHRTVLTITLVNFSDFLHGMN
jgi:hypothetical protein